MNNSQEVIEQFADDLIIRAGFDKLPDQFRQDFKEQIVTESINRLGMMVVAELPEDKLKEYGALLAATADPENDPKIAKLISDGVPDFAAKLAAVLRAYGDEFITEAQKALAR